MHLDPDSSDSHQTRIGRVKTEELALLLELSRTLASDLELEQIYRQAVEAVSRTFGYAMVSLYTLEGEVLVMQHQVGYQEYLESIPLGEGSISRAVFTGGSVYIPNAITEPEFLYAVPGIISMVAVPVRARGTVKAVLCVETEEVALSLDDLHLIEAVALQVGSAVERGLLVASLHEQERLYRTLVETMPSAVTLYDERGFVYANPSALQLYAAGSLEELRKRSIMDFSYSDAPLQTERYERVLTGETLECTEDQMRNLNGEIIDVEVSAHPVILHGRTLGLLAWQDVTQRKRAERALRESEAHYRNRIELSPQIPWIADLNGNITDFNQRWIALTGMSREATVGTGWSAAVHPEDQPRVMDNWSFSIRTGRPLDVEVRFRTKDGSYRWMQSRAYLRLDDQGKPIRWYGTTEDIHDRKEVEAALRRSEGLHRTLVRFSREVVEILDEAGNLLYVSSNVESLGFDPDFWKDHIVNIFEYIPQDYQAQAKHLLEEVLKRTTTVGPLVMPLQKPGTADEWIWFEVLLENRLSDPDIGGLVLRARDVTEQRAFQATIQHMAYHDELTKLPNRRKFAEQAEALIHRAGLEGESCALLYFDLDQFKGINDSLGHQAGDELLIQVAERLRSSLRTADLLARLGGDEMAVMVAGTDETGAIAVAERIRSSLAEPFRIGGLQVIVTASVGVALFPQHAPDLDGLMRAADQAMYDAKEGRDRWAVFLPDLGQDARKQLELIQDLRQALRDNALSLVYQPIVPLRPDLTPKAEVLLRWTHPTLGPVPPSEFIPLAEAHGLAPSLDAWVLEHVLQDKLPKPLEVCVNISALTILDDRSAEYLASAVLEAHLNPSSLRLEVTETAIMRDFHTARKNLETVRHQGVNVALDDFGVGHTSLAHLNRLPIDTLKVDRSFIAAIGTLEGEALLAGILSLAQSLGMATVAEGVETADQLAWLQTHGCDYAQGYYLGRPGPREHLERQLDIAELSGTH